MNIVLSLSEKFRRAIANFFAIDLTHAQVHYANALLKVVSPQSCWLDIGCGHQLLPDWAMAKTEQLQLAVRAGKSIGLDVDSSLKNNKVVTAKVFGIGETLPFSDRSINLITANMVLEHVQEPQRFFVEVARVLKPGGIFLAHTPNAKNYLINCARLVPERPKKLIIKVLEQREQEDVFPTFYNANTKEQLTLLAHQAGLAVEQINCLGSSGSFWRLGLFGWLELGILWLLQKKHFSEFNSVLLCTFKKSL